MLCTKQDKFRSDISRCDSPAMTGLPAGLNLLLNPYFLIALGCDLANWLDHGARLKATSQQPRHAQVQVGVSLQHCLAAIWNRKIWNYFHSEPQRCSKVTDKNRANIAKGSLGTFQSISPRAEFPFILIGARLINSVQGKAKARTRAFTWLDFYFFLRNQLLKWSINHIFYTSVLPLNIHFCLNEIFSVWI